MAPVVVVRRFHEVPAYGAGGHRGIDLQARAGATVRTPCGGTVTFRGSVAGGPPTVTIDCGALRATLQRVRASAGPGRTVARGDAIGVATGTAIDLSARTPAGNYRDPLPLLDRSRAPAAPPAIARRVARPARLAPRALVDPPPIPARAAAGGHAPAADPPLVRAALGLLAAAGIGLLAGRRRVRRRPGAARQEALAGSRLIGVGGGRGRPSALRR